MKFFREEWLEYICRPKMYHRRVDLLHAKVEDVIGSYTIPLSVMVRELISLELDSATNDLLVPVVNSMLLRLSGDQKHVQRLAARLEKQAENKQLAFNKHILKGYGMSTEPSSRALLECTQTVALMVEGELVRLRTQPTREVKTEAALLRGISSTVDTFLRNIGETADPSRATADGVSKYMRYIRHSANPRRSDQATLEVLQRKHLTSFCYSNLDIILGRTNLYDYENFLNMLIDVGHGGMCYQLNHSLAKVLRRLDFTVENIWSTVHGWSESAAPVPGNHLGLRVTKGKGGPWLVDAGLGDGPIAPILLDEDKTIEQGPLTYKLRRFDQDGRTGWTLWHDKRGTFKKVDLEDRFVRLTEFREPAKLQSQNDSPLKTQLSVIMRRSDHSDILRGKWIARRGAGEHPFQELTSAPEFFQHLEGLFGVWLGNISSEERRALWALASKTPRPRDWDAVTNSARRIGAK